MTKHNENSYINWKNWGSSNFLRFSSNEKYYFRKLCSHVNKITNQSNVCEIGFGNGKFLGYCLSLGCKPIAIELNSELRRRATDHGLESYEKIVDTPNDLYFDLVVMLDVLEHIPADQTIIFLSQIVSKLNPKGQIIARFPNGDSSFGLRHQNGDFTHVNSIGLHKCEFIKKQLNLKMIHFGGNANPIYSGSLKEAIKKIIHRFFRICTRFTLKCLLGINLQKYYFDPTIIVVFEKSHEKN